MNPQDKCNLQGQINTSTGTCSQYNIADECKFSSLLKA